MKKTQQQAIHVFITTLLLSFSFSLSQTNDPLQSKCMSQFQKLTPCLDYASAKADTPTSECCSSTKDIRSSDPACLCYIIQQAHAGTDSLKSLGIQLPRLLQLPSVCKLANTSVSNCPSLLNLPAGSPDIAIFKNSSAISNSSTSAQTGSTSDGLANRVDFIAKVAISIVSAIFLSMVSFGA
ncbi:hypothetical protein QJS10_CPB22g00512 [Acorus calamus]|uniref:Bifunctional inhibitor/plant lipid transfer protein/seed storage helical domain-containing protein n=1 Tax=Acorus calamus TaxID=4465 RepID=A0AAV9C1I9_ACOCL|nr:hypothetical protein QJS10_CPB22g00512 [Acorus calamus]